MKTDIEIALEANMKPITEIASQRCASDDLDFMGNKSQNL